MRLWNTLQMCWACGQNAWPSIPLPKKLFRYDLGIKLYRAVFDAGRGTEWTGDELFLKRTSTSDIWVGEGKWRRCEAILYSRVP